MACCTTGDYVLTLVDTLDTFAILGDYENFENGVREVIQHVGFDKDSRVQVFEVTIRMLGGLVSPLYFSRYEIIVSLKAEVFLIALSTSFGKRS